MKLGAIILNSTPNLPDLEAEAVLDSAIAFSPLVFQRGREPNAILLTGATGLLGAYLLHELLNKTTADIYCLIRCSDTEAGKYRLQQHLEFYSLWQAASSVRIIPVVGDLSQPLFGLSEPQFRELASRIDLIYHNGALTDSAIPYEQLKAINVLGTQEILRLASLAPIKPVHFISTVTVFFSHTYAQVDRVRETDIPIVDAGLNNGYKQSKWVAEQLIRVAQARGLPACIYRPFRIMGHSQTGIYGKFKNFFLSFLKACIQMQKFPAFDVELNIVPIDYASQAIVHLSQQAESFGKAFHLINPHSITWKQLIEFIRDLGYALEEVAEEEWLIALEQYTTQQDDNQSEIALPRLLKAANQIRAKKPQFEGSQTIQGLVGSFITCPPVDANLIANYFSYFQKVGYLPVPT